ncbi:hypothetical protein HKD37_16G045735 [Glycine soja]
MRNNAEKRRKVTQDRIANPSGERTLSSESSSSFPANLRKSKVGASETHIMADDQPQRVTLEDYSSSTVPNVQATNISYPHSLIQ